MREVTLSEEEYRLLLARLDNIKPALEEVGRTLCLTAQRAILDEGIGNTEFPHPYNGFSLNIAGIVNDLQSSASVHQYNLENRPALQASGRLLGSLNQENLSYTDDSVTLTSNVPYASDMHFGGITRQAITNTVRENLRSFLRENRQYRERLQFLFTRDQLATDVIPRPFMELDERAHTEMIKSVEAYIVGDMK